MNKQFKMSLFLLQFIKKHLGIFISLVLIVIGSVISALLPSYALKYLIDHILNESTNQKNLIVGTVLYFGSFFLVALFTILQNWIIDIYGQKLLHSLRHEMILKSHRLRYCYFTHHGTGETTSRIIDDVQAIETLFASGLISFIVSFFKIIGIIISIFFFSWMLGLCLLLLIPLIILLTMFFRRNMFRIQIKNRKQINALNNDLVETKENNQVIHNLAKEQFREDGYYQKLEQLYHSRMNIAWFDSSYTPIIDAIKSIFIGGIALLVSFGTGKGNILSLGITVGTFAASLDLISNVFAPIVDLGKELEAMQEGVSGLNRVENFMNEQEMAVKDSSITGEQILKANKLIEAQDLSFHYDDSEELIFNSVSFAIYPKDKVTIIGRTGVGKTTLFRLITGILEPTNGQILIGGKPAQFIPEIEKKKIFGYVEQGFSSVPGTIMDQITLHDESINEEKVREVMKKVFLDDYVMHEIHNNYYATFSVDLFSRGQLQLLSLARALVFNPEILLLDEISANLDSKTEAQIVEVLGDSSINKTVISISHRLSDQLGFYKTLEVQEGNVIITEVKK